jgi:hypothetical protein
MHKLITPCVVVAIVLGVSQAGWSEEKPAEGRFEVAEGKLSFKTPEGWKAKQPKSRIIEKEFEIPAAKGDEIPGRLTVMGAGGAIEANIDRWIGQFEQADGGATKNAAQPAKKKIGDVEVNLVDLTGTYKDNPAPFAGGKPIFRENYRMLAAIVSTKNAGNYFLKLYGPKATIGENEKAFHAMIDSLQVKK